MGIKGLSSFLRKKFPNVFEQVHISEYALQKIAIDTSLYMYIFGAKYNNPDRPNHKGWLNGFLRMFSTLREYDIHVLLAYDTKAPIEKKREQERRRSSREKSKDRMWDVQEAIDLYHETGEVSDLLLDFQKKRKISTSLLQKNQINIKAIEYSLNRTKKNLTYDIKPEDYVLSRELFDILSIPYLLSPSEGETLCSDLCIQGKVSTVLTEDTDCLVYGTPELLTKYDHNTGICVRIRFDTLLAELGFTHLQFIDFAIMCGCDYNDNIPKVGPVKAYDLIKRFGSIEEVGKQGYDISILNHVKSRSLFTDYVRYTDKVPYVGTPDFDRLESFLSKYELSTDTLDVVKRAFQRRIVIELEEPYQDGEKPESSVEKRLDEQWEEEKEENVEDLEEKRPNEDEEILD